MKRMMGALVLAAAMVSAAAAVWAECCQHGAQCPMEKKHEGWKDKEEAVANQDFEKAAALRDQADKLKKKKQTITRDWREKSRAWFRAFSPYSNGPVRYLGLRSLRSLHPRLSHHGLSALRHRKNPARN